MLAFIVLYITDQHKALCMRQEWLNINAYATWNTDWGFEPKTKFFNLLEAFSVEIEHNTQNVLFSHMAIACCVSR